MKVYLEHPWMRYFFAAVSMGSAIFNTVNSVYQVTCPIFSFSVFSGFYSGYLAGSYLTEKTITYIEQCRRQALLGLFLLLVLS
jgi:hypothetical protein